MNLKNLSTEELKTIIDNAPEWAVWYSKTGSFPFVGKVENGHPVIIMDTEGETDISDIDHSWHKVIDSGIYRTLEEIKAELKSRLEIDSNRPEPFTIKTQTETLVTISSIRIWKGTPEQFGKHHEAIIHWCSGGDVECWNCDNWYKDVEPSFSVDEEFRIKQPKPKTGEVWSSDYADVVISENGKGIGFCGEVIEVSEDFHKVADNVKEYLRK